MYATSGSSTSIFVILKYLLSKHSFRISFGAGMQDAAEAMTQDTIHVRVVDREAFWVGQTQVLTTLQ